MSAGTAPSAQPEAAPLREPASIWFPASLAAAAQRRMQEQQALTGGSGDEGDPF